MCLSHKVPSHRLHSRCMPDLEPMRPRDEAVDWKEAERSMGRLLAARDPSLQAADLKDLTQEGMIRLLREVRSGEVTNLNGLTYTIVHRTWVDFIRRRIRDRVRRGLPEGGLASVPAPPQAPLVDPVERIRFIVLEYFRTCSAPCRELAELYFEGRDWQAVASRLGRTHAAIRKQWSRCVDRLRAEADHNQRWRAGFVEVLHDDDAS